ncbi:MAG TPA: NAD(P)-dependent oxidoreductase [Phnomibacter sp.]|nr:NAD(P)-dependent oxidoreductase [Phnomibacter sp.]
MEKKIANLYEPGYYGESAFPLVLITAKCHPWLITQLSARFRVAYLPAITYAQLSQMAGELHGIIVTTRLRIDAPIMEAATQLKWIGRLGSGLELIDLAVAKSKGIQVESSPEGNANAVGEHTLGLLLNIVNRINWSHRQVLQGQWLRDENRGTELTGKTVGIIGYGNTGSAFARLLAPFGVTVLAYDKYRSAFSHDHVKEASLEQVQRYAQFISFHVPLTNDTLHMGNHTFFKGLQQRPVILNTSRGKVIDLTDLKHALEQGWISGAGLDVLENEKLETYTAAEKELVNWLGMQPDVVLTPHIAGYSHEALLKMAEVLFHKLFPDA